jgi:hypothetical protein
VFGYDSPNSSNLAAGKVVLLSEQMVCREREREREREIERGKMMLQMIPSFSFLPLYSAQKKDISRALHCFSVLCNVVDKAKMGRFSHSTYLP